ncbi:Ig-like domain-containing protein [Peribacillus kribbensis]|uniref:Ig-like domain-containing protein n=1 Tax=Peribacillus kribbensis TaxID=356658 RepID=UPI00040058A2|nr:Ig-like domain-containing protein [Peribacillus kribbensis]
MKKLFGAILATSLVFCAQGNAGAATTNIPDKQEIQREMNQVKKEFTFKRSSVRQFKALDEVLYEAEPNDSFLDANSHDIKAYVSGTLEYNDVDVFQIVVPKDGFVVLAGGMVDPSSLSELGMGLFDINEQIIQPEAYDQNEDGLLAFAYTIKAGTYYMAAADMNNIGLGDAYVMKLFTADELNLDTTPPAAPKVNPVDDNDSIVTGTAEANSQIKIKVGSKWIASGKVASNGKYSVKIPVQKAGVSIQVCAVDAANNQSKFTSSMVKDKTPPAAPKVYPVDDNDTVVTGTAEANSQVKVKMGTKWIAAGKTESNGKFSVKIPVQKAGVTLYVCAVDKANNQSKLSSQIVKDKTPPRILTVNKVTTKSTSVTGKTEANASVEVKVGTKSLGKAAADSKGNYIVKMKSQKKNVKLTVIAKDKAGNSRTVTTTVK